MSSTHTLPTPADLGTLVVSDMRDWAMDCDWADYDYVMECDAETIIKGVERHYEGGIRQFIIDGCYA